ncbi:MAG: AAA family ATPase, partial [Thiotrichales bacterium]
QENGVLHSEFDRLFDSLFDGAEVYKDLIRIIAEKREGVARSYIEASSKYLSKGGTLTNKLRDLEDAAFIRSFKPLGHKRQGIYYRIIDEYCYFYLKWIEGTKRTLTIQESGNKYWSNKTNAPEYYSWMGYAFESICYKHIGEIRIALDIHVGVSIGTWRYSSKQAIKHSGAQIDLVFERNDGVTTICEIKYSDKPFVINTSYADNLKQKVKIYKEQTRTKNHLHISFISASGIKENKHSLELVDGIVTLDDLFKAVL